jgi:hypothetical protein
MTFAWMNRPDTLVFQSYRPVGTPDWLARCLASVAGWAAAQGHAYTRLGDEFFEIVPGWFVDRCGDERLPVTDFARLLWARRYLEAGWRRVIWLDADVLIPDPARFAIPDTAPHALGREYWLWRAADGALAGRWAVNNAVAMFTAGSSLLPFYIDACETLVRAALPVDRLALGPKMLSALNAAVPLPLVPDLATLSPTLIAAIAGGDDGEAPAAHAAAWRAPVAAMHLCRSVTTIAGGLGLIEEARVARAVERLLREPRLLD